MENANPVSGWQRAAWVVLTAWALALTSCAGKETAAEAEGGTKPLAHFFPLGLGGQTVQAQFAISLPEMQRGLMDRRDLAPDQGMIFVYRTPQAMSFWMRNTPTPLDIGFFTSDGVLREVYQLHPYDETAVSSRRADLQYALEMNQGWFAEHGVKPGAQLDMKAVAAAVKARGFNPSEFQALGE